MDLFRAIVIGTAMMIACGCLADDSGQNRIGVPDFVGGAADREAGDQGPKLQYLPREDEKPVLRRATLPEEISRGARYPGGEEIVVDPDGGFDLRDDAVGI